MDREKLRNKKLFLLQFQLVWKQAHELEFLEKVSQVKEGLEMVTCIFLLRFKKISFLREKKKIFFLKYP